MVITENGNQFVKEPHIWIPGDGVYYATKADAERNISANACDCYGETMGYNGKTWYRIVNRNVWD